MSAEKTLCYSFPSLTPPHADILILGSMPGAESLRQQQYYAHPRNAFWPIMQTLFAVDINADYSRRCEQLMQQGVAVWDVLKACHRPGSLDQHIVPDSIEANDFNQFFHQNQHILAVFFNGGKAESVFKRYVAPTLSSNWKSLPLIRLPSTSPAHAALNLQKKTILWQAAIRPYKIEIAQEAALNVQSRVMTESVLR